jgi:hypothetical protein
MSIFGRIFFSLINVKWKFNLWITYDYFIISATSTGKSGGLSNQVLGACNSSNMKLEIHICCSSTNNNTQRKCNMTLPHSSPPPKYTIYIYFHHDKSQFSPVSYKHVQTPDINVWSRITQQLPYIWQQSSFFRGGFFVTRYYSKIYFLLRTEMTP